MNTFNVLRRRIGGWIAGPPPRPWWWAEPADRRFRLVDAGVSSGREADHA